MKACVLHNIADLRYEDAPGPSPGPGEVLLQIKACGICGSDIQRVWDKGTYSFPTIPGHEFAGLIIAVGEGTDKGLIGKKAAVFPLLPCMRCDACRIGEYAQCTDYNYFGSRCNGGFAELISVPVWNLVIIPESLSYEEAAMAEPAAVAVHALRQAGITIGDNAAIFGAGPIGLMLASWAKIWGADKAILIDVDRSKIDFARSLSFEHIIDAGKDDPVSRIMQLTDGRGADIAVEGAGVSVTLEQCLKCVRMFGKVVAMGNPIREMTLSQKGYWELLRKQLTISGTWNSSYTNIPKNDWELAVKYMAANRIETARFITHRVPLEKCQDALRMMKDKTEFFNKVMIVME